MTLPELRAKIAEYRRLGVQQWAPLVEIHKKFAIPFAALIFGFLGVAMGVLFRRGEKLVSFALSVGIAIVYYVFLLAGEPLGKQGRLHPFWAMWAANIFFAAATALLYRKVLAETPFALAPAAAAAAAAGDRRVSILQRYVGREFLKIFALCFGGLLGTYVLVDFFQRIDLFLNYPTPVRWKLLYFALKVPRFVFHITPVSMLVALLVTLGILNRNREITAVKCGGRHPPPPLRTARARRRARERPRLRHERVRRARPPRARRSTCWTCASRTGRCAASSARTASGSTASARRSSTSSSSTRWRQSLEGVTLYRFDTSGTRLVAAHRRPQRPLPARALGVLQRHHPHLPPRRVDQDPHLSPARHAAARRSPATSRSTASAPRR